MADIERQEYSQQLIKMVKGFYQQAKIIIKSKSKLSEKILVNQGV